MCGIAGIFHPNDPLRPVRQEDISSMLQVIRHRGPDESGIYLGGNSGMGNVRLSIIDLVSGSQPLSDQEQRYWIVYNGEIFNYPEIREELTRLGYSFTTTSDTEVVVQAYAAWGPDCLTRFNGQFAISIWDNQKKELFLARDRAGIRPLYYTEYQGSFYFCSEIKGLFQNPEIPRSFSKKGISQIFQFWTTLPPETPYEGVYELLPGHYMQVNEQGITQTCYWSLDFPAKGTIEEPGSINESIENFRTLFRNAVKIRLRADVEVAAYLSGGIDSTVTTAFIHELEPRILNTFSIGFSDKNYDESVYQKEASSYFQTNHTSFSCTAEDIGKHFWDTVYFGEYPILRTAPVPMYLLSEKVRARNIKVVITGEGADEILAGYNIFKEAKIRRFWANEPGSAARPLLLKKLYPYLPAIRDAKNSALKLFFGYALSQTSSPYYSHLLRWHNTSRIRNYFNREFIDSISNYDWRHDLNKITNPEFEAFDDLAKAQYLEFKIFMSNYLLSSQGDRMAMGNSVEGRYPFLDHRVIEFASRLPERYKLNILNEKFILKKMMKDRIPDSIMNRNKQAYRAPVSDSFLGENAPDFVMELLNIAALKSSGYFDPSLVAKLIDRFENGKMVSEIDQMALAGILSVQILHHMFIEGNELESKKNDLQKIKVIRDISQ